MTNTPVLLEAQVKVRPRAVMHTDNTAMHMSWIGGIKSFATSINEASGRSRAFHMKTKGKAAKLWNFRFSSVERQ